MKQAQKTPTDPMHERYEQLEVIGDGGQGRTLLAKDRQTSQLVVIKFVFDSDPEALRHEYRLLACLRHPNLVRAIELFNTVDGVAFVQEHAPGVDFARWLTTQKRSPTEIVAVGAAIGRALDYLHASGVVHRDVKPNNIVVGTGRIGALPAARLVDLGLATHKSSPEISGTPGYIAPEILEGRPVTPQADIFGLGTLLLQALVGTPSPPTASAVAMLKRRKPELSELLQVLDAMRAASPDDRPNATMALRDLGTVMGADFQLSTSELLQDYFPQPILVGRESELATIDRALRDALAKQAGCIELRGHGKSALASEVSVRARLMGFRVLLADSPAALLRSAKARDDGTPLSQLAARIIETWCQSKDGPTLVVLDPLDAEDPLMKTVIHQLDADAAGGNGVVVLHCGSLPQSACESNWITIDLPALEEHQVKQLVRRMLYHADEIPWIDDVFPATAGAPARIHELVRAQIAAGLPPVLLDPQHADVDALVADLSPVQKDLLGTVGQSPCPIPLAMLGSVARETMAELGPLLSRDLLAADDRGIRLGRQAKAIPVRDLLSQTQRERLHQKLAAAWSENNDADPAILGHHYVHARQPIRAAPLLLSALAPSSADLQLTVEQIAPEVPQWRGLVARLARIRRARGNLDSALALVGHAAPRDPGYFALLAAELLLDAGQPARALEALSDVPEDGPAVALIRSRARILGGEFATAADDARHGLEQPGLSTRLRLRLQNTLALSWVYLGRCEESATLLQETAEVARQHDPDEGLARILNSLGIAQQRLGLLGQAKAAFEEASALFDRLGDLRHAATCRLNQGTLAHRRFELQEALAAYQHAGALSRRAEMGTTWAWAVSNEVHLLAVFGDLEKATELSNEALELARAESSESLEGHLLVTLGELSRLQQRTAEGQRYLQSAKRLFSDADQPGRIALWVAEGDLQLDRGLWKQAKATCERLLSVLDPSDPDHWRARLLAARVALSSTPPLLEEATTQLQAALADEHVRSGCERTWELHALMADAQLRLGRKQHSRQHAEYFTESLASLRKQVPSRYRDLFDARADVVAARDLVELLSAPRAPSNEALLGMLSINRDLNQGIPFDQLADRILEAMVSLTRAERGFIIERQNGRLRVRASRNLDGDAIPRQSVRYSRSIVERALEEARPLLIGDAGESDLSDNTSIVGLQLRSVLCVPVSVRRELEGALYLDNRFSADAFDDSTVLLVQGFAEQVGIAIDNSRMLRELTTHSEKLAEAKGELEQLNSKLAARVNQHEERLTEMSRRLRDHEEELVRRFRAQNIVGHSKPMQELFVKLDRVAQVDLPVYLSGESGTGKELAARAIHAEGPRAKEPFLAINCGAIPSTLLESELFGYVRGAFTGAERDRPGVFELAAGGTLFLDEVGDMEPEMQVKLLRVLQEGTFRRLGDRLERQSRCRVLSASHHRLDELVEEGRFREDLFYRINVFQIDVPPLRERRGDIPLLVRTLLDGIAPGLDVDSAAMLALLDYDWPGNIRQLQNELQRAALVADGPISVADLSPALQQRPALRQQSKAGLRDAVRDFERRMIVATLEQERYRVTPAAQRLGLHRVALHRRMKALGISRKELAE